MSKLAIRPILLNKYILDKSLMLYRVHFRKTMASAGYIWYIEGASGNVIVDSAADIALFKKLGYPIEPVRSIEEGLASVGVKPSDIDTIILTHSHHDHLSGARHFPNARVVIQEAEVEFLRHPHPYFANEVYPEMIDGLKLEVVKGDTMIQEGLRVLLTPGHTPGTQSVAVDTEKGTAVICGFCCIRENFDPPPEVKPMWSMLPPTIHTNLYDAYDSMVRVKKVADIIVPLHDPELCEQVRIP